MTDLTAYEQALVERVAMALYDLSPEMEQPVDLDWRPTGPAGKVSFETIAEISDEIIGDLRADAKAILTALGLIGPSRTAWLAPWEASEGMVAESYLTTEGKLRWQRMRDAHLKETS